MKASIADNDSLMKSCIILETYQPTTTGRNLRERVCGLHLQDKKIRRDEIWRLRVETFT
jgi:hypothetical protein